MTFTKQRHGLFVLRIDTLIFAIALFDLLARCPNTAGGVEPSRLGWSFSDCVSLTENIKFKILLNTETWKKTKTKLMIVIINKYMPVVYVNCVVSKVMKLLSAWKIISWPWGTSSGKSWNFLSFQRCRSHLSLLMSEIHKLFCTVYTNTNGN